MVTWRVVGQQRLRATLFASRASRDRKTVCSSAQEVQVQNLFGPPHAQCSHGLLCNALKITVATVTPLNAFF